MTLGKYSIIGFVLAVWATCAATQTVGKHVTLELDRLISGTWDYGFAISREHGQLYSGEDAGFLGFDEVLTIFTVTGQKFDFVSVGFRPEIATDQTMVIIEGSRDGVITGRQTVRLAGKSNNLIGRQRAFPLNSGFDNVDRVQLRYSSAKAADIIENFTFGLVGDSNPPAVRSISLQGMPPPNAQSVTYNVAFDEVPLGVSISDFSLATTGTVGAEVTRALITANVVKVVVSNISGKGSLRLDLNERSGIVDRAGNGNGANGYVAGFGFGDKHNVDTGIIDASQPKKMHFEHSTPKRTFAAARPEVEKIFASDTLRSLDTHIETNRSMLRDARDRLISDGKKRKTCVNFAGDRFCQDTHVRDAVDFDVDGMARIKDRVFRSHATFSAARSTTRNEAQRIVAGDFDIRVDRQGAGHAGISTRLAWEYMPGGNKLVGFHIGTRLGSSTIRGSLRGRSDGISLSAGPYFVSSLSKDLLVSGFATLGYRRAEMEARNKSLAMESNHASYWTAAELTLTGRHQFTRFSLHPEMSLNFGKARSAPTGIEIRAFGLADQIAFRAPSVFAVELVFQPELRIPMIRPHLPDAKGMFKIAPGVSCQQIRKVHRRKNCSGSLRLTLKDSRRDGLSKIDTAFELRNKKGRESVGLKIAMKYRF